MTQCSATTRTGRACAAPALRGEVFCFTHSPSQTAARSAARRLGGYNRKTAHAGDIGKVPAEIRTIAGVLSLLDFAKDETLALDNSLSRTRAIVALAGTYVSAIEDSEIEQRISALEDAMRNREDR